jgi:hypothetical protein
MSKEPPTMLPMIVGIVLLCWESPVGADGGAGVGRGGGGSVGGGVGAGVGLIHPAVQSLMLLNFPVESSTHVYLLSSHLNIFGVGLGVGFGLGPG